MMEGPIKPSGEAIFVEPTIMTSQSDGSISSFKTSESDTGTIIDLSSLKHSITPIGDAAAVAAAAGVDATGVDEEESHSLDKGKGKEISQSHDDEIQGSTDSSKPSRIFPRSGTIASAMETSNTEKRLTPPPAVPPKSPRNQTYALPIGGGPKKAFVVSGGKRNQASSSTRFVSASSSKSRNSAPSVPSIPEVHKRFSNSSFLQDESFTAPPTLPEKPLNRSVSTTAVTPRMALGYEKPGLDLGGWPSESPLGRRRTLSTSTTEEAKVLAGSNDLGRAKSAASNHTADDTTQRYTSAKSTFEDAPSLNRHSSDQSFINSQRRGTASSVVMVEGQMFEINDEEEKAAPAISATARRSIEPLHALEEDQAKEDDSASNFDTSTSFPILEEEEDSEEEGSLRNEPMVLTDDEIDDIPPPGAYAIHPPSKTRLAKAADLPLFDEDGKIVEFGSIFETRRTLICFLRHWLCPFCQMFSQSLQHIDPLPLQKANLDLVVVGQGHWHVTKSYKEVMKIPSFVKMYSDPSRQIYKVLGMTLRTNDAGPACARPDYQTMGVFKASMVAIKKGVIDMPLRPPGDLMLLGGEFILGPGLHCSFTHRMVTTRGHLDLPRILVQAGCDLSLKTPVDLYATPRRPGSTKSLDRSNARKIARKFSRRRVTNARMASQNEEIVKRLAGDRTNTLKALNGDHISNQAKTLPKSIGKKRQADIRNMKIGHPIMDLDESPSSRRMSDSRLDSQESTPEYTRQYTYNHGASLPPSPTSPLQLVKDRLATGMVTGFSKSQSMGEMNIVFSRPPRSAQRPPVPPTSSSEAFAAASARATEYGRSPPQSPTAYKSLASSSVPTLTNQSSASVQTIQPQNGRQHQQTASTSTTADSTYNSRHDTLFSINSNGSSQTSYSQFSGESPLTQSLQGNLLTPSNSLKRINKASTGTALSALEAGRAATFSTSSPSLPLSPSFPDPSRSRSSLRSPSVEFGEDTEYRRLDKRILEQPEFLFDEHNESDEERDVPLSVSDQEIDDESRSWSPYKDMSNLTSLSVNTTNGLTHEQEEDLQKTPLARKISLDFAENHDHPGNRSSIIEGTAPPTKGVFPRSVSSSSNLAPSPASGAFAQNALFAGLPSQSTPITQNTKELPSSRAPVSAPAPLFATLLAEEAARSHDDSQTNGNAIEPEKAARRSPKKEPKALAPNRMTMGASFLDDMDVHDGFVRDGQSSDSIRHSLDSETSYYESDEYEGEEGEDDDDDWAPLQASGNVVPARLSSEVGDEDDSRASSRTSFVDDEDSMYDDEEGDMDKDGAAFSRMTPSPSQEYELRKVTGRVTARQSTAPVVSIPRKVKGNSSQQMYKQHSLTGLSASARRLTSFREEEEEEEEGEDEETSQGSGVQTPI